MTRKRNDVRKWFMAAACIAFGLFFACVGAVFMLKYGAPVRGLAIVGPLALGWLAMAWSLLSGQRTPGVVGGCLVLAALVVLFARAVFVVGI
jgi:hypothetical protein